jgi:hypothetical protein
MSAQFYILRAVADALPIEGVAPEARASGITGARLEYSTVHSGPAQVRITCAPDVARYLVERLRELAGAAHYRHDEALLIECAKAVDAALEAIEAEARRASAGPVDGIRKAMG